jgi:hypothetical protein
VYKLQIFTLVGPLLWGAEAMNPKNARFLKKEYQEVTEALIAEVWDRMIRKGNRWEKDWKRKLDELEAAFDGER